jgi:hypothetical protein
MYQSFCVATLTKNIGQSQTCNDLRLIVNRGGTDVLNHIFNVTEGRVDGPIYYLGPGSPAESTGRGEAQWYGFEAEVGEEPVRSEDDFYVRVSISGANLWRPAHIVVFAYETLWGRETSSGDISYRPTPLAVETDLPTDLKHILSCDYEEGVPSMPIHRVAPGDDDTVVNRLLCVIRTCDENWSCPGTDEPIYLRVRRKGENDPIVHYDFPDTTQTDFEAGATNMFIAPVWTPFARRELDDESFELGIKGNEAWVVGDVLVFGIDTGSGRPNTLVPLVDVQLRSSGADHAEGVVRGRRLSTDETEGVPFLKLPLSS